VIGAIGLEHPNVGIAGVAIRGKVSAIEGNAEGTDDVFVQGVAGRLNLMELYEFIG
jgi:hypothetical protein